MADHILQCMVHHVCNRWRRKKTILKEYGGERKVWGNSTTMSSCARYCQGGKKQPKLGSKNWEHYKKPVDSRRTSKVQKMHILLSHSTPLAEDTLNPQCKPEQQGTLLQVWTVQLLQAQGSASSHCLLSPLCLNLAGTLTHASLHLHCPRLKYDHRLTMKPLSHFKVLSPCGATQGRQQLTWSCPDNVNIHNIF